MHQPPIVITPGDPAGIGPDILLALVAKRCYPYPIVAIADYELLQTRAQRLEIKIQLSQYQPGTTIDSEPGVLPVWHVPLNINIKPGKPNPLTASYILTTLTTAATACQNNRASALVTGPVNKYLINEAGVAFSGHTEFLAQFTNTSSAVMMLMTPTLKVALLTTHLPLSQVATHITPKRITQCVKIIMQALTDQFSVENPHLLVCGLNPHAGESGLLGKEEQTIITPTLNQLRQQYRWRITGPVSADTAFIADRANHVDAILAMYHDQALPVVKTLSFEQAVNVTLGLPIIRTSVDHGTAYELAGTNRASFNSLAYAIETAYQMTQNR